MSDSSYNNYNKVGNQQQNYQYQNQNQQYGAPSYGNQNQFNNNMGGYDYGQMNSNQMGQPVGQPLGAPQMVSNNSNYMQPPNQYQNPQMGPPINQIPIGSPFGSSYSDSQQRQYQNPPMSGYYPPSYSQGVPIDAQNMRVQGSGSQQQNLPSNLDNFGQPSQFRCNFCQKESVSTMTVEPGSGTWMLCCCLCILGGIPGIIPFCVNDCQDKKHFCQYCGAQVGLKEYSPC